MKKIMQNVLAKNSNNDIAYLCGKCGKEIEKEAVVCSFCGAKLGSIRCPFCNFTGTVNDFKYDTCPKCGRKNRPPGRHLNKSQNKIQPSEFSLTSKLFWILLFLLLGGIAVIILAFLYNFDLI